MNRDSATRIGVKTALLVANPAAGGYRPRRIEALSTALSRRGIVTDVRLTRAPGDMQFIATDPETRPDVLIVAGGDGSINEAVAGLLVRHGPRPALAVMPAGTANVLAAELRLPRQPVNVARSIAGGLTKPLAVAQANGRPFMLMASAGFDAEVVHAVRPEQKRRWKQLAFIGTAWSLAFGRKPTAWPSPVASPSSPMPVATAARSRWCGKPRFSTVGSISWCFPMTDRSRSCGPGSGS
jgi:diacylglycerol kinase family enzyme